MNLYTFLKIWLCRSIYRWKVLHADNMLVNHCVCIIHHFRDKVDVWRWSMPLTKYVLNMHDDVFVQVTDTCLLLLISMLWHRQAIFKSKGDKLCSSAECRIWTRGPRHQIASRLNARWQTDWAIEDQAKNSTACPYDQRAFSPLDPTVSWLSHWQLSRYIFWFQ